MARSMVDIINMALDEFDEPELTHEDRPVGDLQRKAIRRYQDAVEEVLVMAPFDDARTESTITAGPVQPLEDEEGRIYSEIPPIVFTPEFRSLQTTLTLDRETSYAQESILPGIYGGFMWHVNGYEHGWKVVRTPQGGAVLRHNFSSRVRVVFNALVTPAQMGLPLANAVAATLACLIAPTKDGKSRREAELQNKKSRAVHLAAISDRGGEPQALHSPMLVDAKYGINGPGTGFGSEDY